MQHTNYGGGAPIIRGLVGNQILVLVDGIRLNNAVYRLGPNQYLNTIETFLGIIILTFFVGAYTRMILA